MVETYSTTEKIGKLKELFRSLKDEGDHKKALYLRKEFKEFLGQCDALTIARAEQELAKEGFTLQDFRSGCDVHLEMMRESLGQQGTAIPAGHPLTRFQQEHEAIICWINELLEAVRDAQTYSVFGDAKDALKRVEVLTSKLGETENHNIRQENALFPLLERHGISEPPRVMWGEHREMKEMKTKLHQAFETIDASNYLEVLSKMEETALLLEEYFASHTKKEQTILYPIAMRMFSPDEWKEFSDACEELGYFSLEA
ncbi:MAG: hypothetical protein A2Y33_13850 [Spirochaetes bacterium GWF1_51_8]|nr:MAG: hypothetical protein A2Y33_13850 [Spirochaetes bacterium GWF1_51_8]